MKKYEYQEPIFNVVVTSTEDIITTSGEGGSSSHSAPSYSLGPFEAPIISI